MSVEIRQGDCRTVLKELPEQFVQCCVTSPPYFGLRDYGCEGQIGLEPTPKAYVETLVGVFRGLWRVLRDDGTLWLNLGDSYNSGTQFNHHSSGLGDADRYAEGRLRGEWSGHRPAVNGLKSKDLIGIPWRVAFALQSDGWYLRSDIIWAKPNPMPESVTDRPTKAHEYIFLLSKSPQYYYDHESIKEQAEYREDERPFGDAGGNRNGDESSIYRPNPNRNDLGASNVGGFGRLTRNKRSVWTVTLGCYSEAHFATFPPGLIRPCILAGSKPGDTILDPFGGSGTVGEVALEYGRKAILIELNPAYIPLIERRTNVTPGLPL